MAIRKRTITLSDEEWDALRRLAEDGGTTRHTFFRRLAQAAALRFPAKPETAVHGVASTLDEAPVSEENGT